MGRRWSEVQILSPRPLFFCILLKRTSIMLTLKQMKEIAKEISFRWNPSIGQNFLYDHNILREIVEFASRYDTTHVIEIGAGMGNLTEALSTAFPEIVAVEIDKRLCTYLKERFSCNQNIKIVCKDILQAELQTLLKPQSLCVSNIPYYISTPLIIKLLRVRSFFKSIILLTQKEVVERLIAQPSTKVYGPLSIYAQLTSTVSKIKDIPPTVFYPRPKVESVLVEIKPKKSPLFPVNEESFINFLRSIFLHRRKTIFNNLKTLLPERPTEEISSTLFTLRINHTSRAEGLKPEIWIELFKSLFLGNLIL